MGKLELDLLWGLDINSAWSIIMFQLIKKIKKINSYMLHFTGRYQAVNSGNSFLILSSPPTNIMKDGELVFSHYF